MLDRSFQRKVLELKVRCSKKNDGCQWVGELRHVVPHEREECRWAVVECSYQCGAHLSRRLMDEHQRDECPQRPMDVKLERFMKKMEVHHEREMIKMETRLTAMDTRLVTERERHEREMRKMKEEHKREMAELKENMEFKIAELKVISNTYM